ncbi:MAG TPA: hypothetical protein VFW87_25925 [Pirellulales bacterium]|nr:hypothetical protein [Pirellulales bacterium]
MGTTFVTADGEHGFWMRDGVLELWLRLLALHIPDQVSQPGGFDSETVHRVSRQILDHWMLASKGGWIGCVPVNLEDAVSTPEGKAVVTTAIQSLRDALNRHPGLINKDALNLLGFKRSHLVFVEDVEARGLLDVADAFCDVIDGKITDTARQTDRMPGSR